LQSANFFVMISMAPVPLKPESVLIPGLLAASIRGRPDQALEHAKEVVVDAIQVTLGEVLLVLVGIAVVLLVIILVLFEADLILKLGGKLSRRLGPGGSDPTGSKLPAKGPAETDCEREERGSR
jgi:hypothetical protein